MRQVLTEEEKWRDLVGGFILAFGEIELFTHHLWPSSCPNQRAPRLFKPRATALLNALRKEPARNRSTIESLEDALKLLNKRNTVAHNPTMVEAFEHSQTGQLVVKRGIFSRQSKDFIDEADLTELMAAAEDIVGRLYHAHGMPRDEQAGS